MQPIGDYERQRRQPEPLDLQRAGFGGYQARAVEELVAKLRDENAMARQANEQLKREINEQQSRNGELGRKLAVLADQNKKLRFKVDQPYQAFGEELQGVVDAARAKSRNVMEEANAQAEKILSDARAKGDGIIGDAEKDAADQVRQATERSRQIEAEAAERLRQSKAQADDLIAQADKRADAITRTAREQAGRLLEEAKNTVVDANRRKADANQAVDRARRLLSDALTALTPPPTRTEPTTPTQQ